MLGFNRRDVLVGALASLSAVQARGAERPPSGPPRARLEPAIDTYFGEQITDPYRWMERPQDPDWLPFLRGQNAYTRSVLDALPGRERLRARIAELSAASVETAAVQRAGGHLFFEQRPQGADSFKLFVSTGGAPRLLIDPQAMAVEGGHMSLDWWAASPDGRHVAYGLSPNGGEDSVLHVLSTADGRVLSEAIANTQWSNLQWLPDSSGFFYRRLTSKVGAPERFLDSEARLHILGEDPARDRLIMKRGLNPEVEFDRIQVPTILTFAGADHALLTLSDVRKERMVFAAPLDAVVRGEARWTPVATFEDLVAGVVLRGDDLLALSYRDAPLGRVLRTSLAAPDLQHATVAAPEGASVIQGLHPAADGLYLDIMDGGVNRLRRLRTDGRIDEVRLPFDGSIEGIFTSPQVEGAMFHYEGWLSPPGIWAVDAAGRVADTGLTPRPPIDLSAYETVRGFAQAADGARIPYSLVYRKGLKRDGQTPAYISAYGAYGYPYVSVFAGRLLSLVDEGFIIGDANVRGGGEYGRPWHEAGQHERKANTWRDLIAVCEHLCEAGYTAPSRLTVEGGSAGGVTVGRALTERPDLFRAVIDKVGWSNPLRYVVEQESFTEEPEWGAITDPEGFRWLKAMDSYQAVRDGVRYPAVLLTTGASDPRVAPFHATKMTARLQAASRSGRPVLLRVEFDGGHGIGSTRAQQDAEALDCFSFLLWQVRS